MGARARLSGTLSFIGDTFETYGKSREAMAALAVTARSNANRNPDSIFYHRPLTTEDYLNGRMISEPLCLFDCDIPVTACAAVVLTTADRTAGLRQRPVYLGAATQQSCVRPPAFHDVLYDYMESGRAVASELWAQSGLGPKDMSAAELYDGFSPSAIYWLEAAGFCERGEGLDFIQDGRIIVDGPLPVNTFGGSLSQGRLHGMGHIVEGVHHLRGNAGLRQVANPAAIVVLDGSPMTRGGGLVLMAERSE
jgi:acetyl-CoA acetyltransferase